ncbi:hypothetical protein CBR_g17098 [Chara braunii]|uniref:OB domain-containing protein n=1 Tax=Chara braunii TaxID=69332 RepID=A0A388KUS7_CHABU|nr:hypothetical protein CBR_g17098 [Chara braunii]|eukprot:GBG73758.1 hypothetical protein CBR_g17098 [Chara braunii]
MMYGGGESYGGASQFDGGGFVSTPGGMTDGGGGSLMSPSGKGGRGSQSNALFPVTVKQVVSAQQKSEENFINLDGQDVYNVTLLGRIVSKDVRNTETSYILDDGTGQITIKQWKDVDNDDEIDQQRLVSLGMYVRVHGHIRIFLGTRGILAFDVRQIEDYNEVTAHFTECIFVHLYNKRAAQGGVGGTPMSAMTQEAGGGYGGGPGSAQQTPTRANVGNQYLPSAQTPGDNGGGVPDLQRIVLSIYEDASSVGSEEGVHVQTVISRLAGQYPEKKIR